MCRVFWLPISRGRLADRTLLDWMTRHNGFERRLHRSVKRPVVKRLVIFMRPSGQVLIGHVSSCPQRPRCTFVKLRQEFCFAEVAGCCGGADHAKGYARASPVGRSPHVNHIHAAVVEQNGREPNRNAPSRFISTRIALIGVNSRSLRKRQCNCNPLLTKDAITEWTHY